MPPPRDPWLRDHLRAAGLALSFLTTLPLPPLGEVREGDFARASRYYPLAGYAVGGLVALVLWLPLPLPAGVRAALAVGAWLALTGLLHFDGLVDSADALFVMKSPARRLEILRDVHVGAFGLATGGLALLALHSLLAAPLPPLAPLVAAVVARTALLWPMWRYPAARAGQGQQQGGGLSGGLGAASRPASLGTLGVALVLSAPTLLVPGAWAAWLAGAVAAALLARFGAARLGGGLTGDIYGMIVTVTELVVLCAFAWGRG